MKFLLPFIFCFIIHALSAQHCCHKRDWQADTMPPPPLMKGIGKNYFKITTANDSAQLFFDQGLRLVHGYWDFEAYRAFKRAAELDSNCALMPLGIAMVYFSSHEDQLTPAGKKYMNKARSLCDRVALSEKENNLIEVYDKLFNTDDYEGYAKDLEALCKKYPDETEFKLFYANRMIDSYADGKATPSFTSCDSILEIIMAKEPDNFAAHHYYIHNIQESPLCEKGLHSAEVIAELAPAIGHIQHMPGHIYYNVGDYEKARTVFLKAREVDSLYLVNSGVDPVNHWNNVHNMVYLAFNDIEQGRHKEAIAIAKHIQTIEMTPDQFDRSQGMKSAYLVDQFLANGIGNWDLSIALTSVPLDIGKDTPFLEWKRKLFFYYAHSMKAFENDQKDSVNYYSKKMKKHFKALKANLSPGMNYKEIKEYHEKAHYNEVLACKLFMNGDINQAFSVIDSSIKFNKQTTVGDPPVTARFNEETKIRFLVKQLKYEEAVSVYELLLTIRKNSPLLYYELAEVCFLAGKKKEAKEYVNKALQGWKYADKDLSALSKAKELNEELK